MSDKKEYVFFQTPLGKCRYPKLLKQDTYEGKEVGYKCCVLLDENDVAKVRKEIDAAIAKLAPGGKLKNGKKSPIRETEDGQFYIEAKSYKKVPLFKAKGGHEYPETTDVGGGSVIRMKLSLSMGNGHLVAYMNAIQIAKLIEGRKEGFDDVDGYDEDNSEVETSEEGYGSGDDLDI